MERNPKAFKNNILELIMLLRQLTLLGSKMVMISTNKAVNPPNVIGQLNVLIAELIVTS